MNYDSLLNDEYTAETTEDYGEEEILHLPYPVNYSSEWQVLQEIQASHGQP